jgi:hypothetical protein
MTAPDGWRCVPVEPTDDMKIAGANNLRGTAVNSRESAASWAYQAMLKAAPPAPAPAVEGVTWRCERKEGHDHEKWGGLYEIYENNGDDDVFMCSAFGTTEEDARQIAERVVAAVNSYPSRRQLVEALRRAERVMDACRSAVSSGQVIDKDVEGELTRGRDAVRHTLAQEPTP